MTPATRILLTLAALACGAGATASDVGRRVLIQSGRLTGGTSLDLVVIAGPPALLTK